MRYEKEFMVQREARNGAYNDVLCLVIFLLESLVLAIYCLGTRAGWLEAGPGYLRFYVSALIGTAVFPFLDRWMERWPRAHVLLRLTALNALLLWANLLSVFDISQGYGGAAFIQMLLFTSAGLRLPVPLHYGINTAHWLCYLAVLRASGAVRGMLFYNRMLDSGIFLVISCVVIHITLRFQYDAYLALRDRTRVREAQLDTMAQQVEQLRRMADQVLVIRHDLRHYAWAVEQNAEAGDLAAIRALTEKLFRALGQTQARPSVRNYTGVAAYDAILSRYAAWCAANGAAYQVTMTAPDWISQPDFTLLLMNALENAANAVQAQDPQAERYIQVHSGGSAEQYYLEIINTCRPGSVSFHPGSGLPAAGAAGHGYGTKSMAEILERYGAFYRFQASEGTFRFQFLLSSGGQERPQAARPARW